MRGLSVQARGTRLIARWRARGPQALDWRGREVYAVWVLPPSGQRPFCGPGSRRRGIFQLPQECCVMNRKWTVLPVAMAGVAVLAAGFTIADDKDDESPTKKVMEKVQKVNIAITKAVRTPVAFKKAQKDVPSHAEEIVKLAKEARTHKGPSEKQKQPYEKWTE